jgi:hypothetical protein
MRMVGAIGKSWGGMRILDVGRMQQNQTVQRRTECRVINAMERGVVSRVKVRGALDTQASADQKPTPLTASSVEDLVCATTAMEKGSDRVDLLDGISNNRGKVGIFWLVDGKILYDALPLGQAETYGCCLGYAAGHEDVWKRLATNASSTDGIRVRHSTARPGQLRLREGAISPSSRSLRPCRPNDRLDPSGFVRTSRGKDHYGVGSSLPLQSLFEEIRTIRMA